MVASHMTRSPDAKGARHTNIFQSGFLTILYDFLLGFYADFGGFWPFLGDLEPKLRPDLGEKLGFDSNSKSYKNQRFWQP
jgi:hypothetical protein